MTTLDAVTLAVAVLGAVLGVFNTWRAVLQDRVRLRVRVSSAIATPSGAPLVLVHIVNLSSFDVTVRTLGFLMLGSSGEHAQVPMPVFAGGERMPVRMAPRTSITSVTELGAREKDLFQRTACAYVLTACGEDVRSPRREFGKLRAALAAKHGPGRA